MQSEAGALFSANKYPFFIGYLWNIKGNRLWWVAGFVAFLLQFVIFKLDYPFANYMPDSYYYLEAAARNVDVNVWPVGYSKFLRVMSAVTHSDLVVTGLQYGFLQISGMLFVFSLMYWVPVSNTSEGSTSRILIGQSNPALYRKLHFGRCTIYWLQPLLDDGVVVDIIPADVERDGDSWHSLLACFTLRYNAISLSGH